MAASNPWQSDSLQFSDYGETFTNLIKSIDNSKVISIEAGFGQGKTFFRQAWAEHLRQAGELVIEIDAQQSDHSGDPIVTFLGALLSASPTSGKPLPKQLAATSLKLAGVASRAIARAVLKTGAEELIRTASDWMKGAAPDFAAIDNAVDEIGEGMSTTASQLLATHLAAERARNIELPEQIDALRDALTEGAESKRIIIIIDELDRCHPEYAISLLEAMKLVFRRDGFVFCLMVNPHYLESIAHHRFGTKALDEPYLEKFIDLRLSLKANKQTQAAATKALVEALRVEIPFGDTNAFTSAAAGEVAEKIVLEANLSFRQIKRIVDRIDLALRCYRKQPIDLPLLVHLAFADALPMPDGRQPFDAQILPRAQLTQETAKRLAEAPKGLQRELRNGVSNPAEDFIRECCIDLKGLPEDRYRLPPPQSGKSWMEWYLIIVGLGSYYVPSHRAMLAGVQKLMV